MVKQIILCLCMLVLSYEAVIQIPTNTTTNGTQTNATGQDIVSGRSFTTDNSLSFADLFQPTSSIQVPTTTTTTTTSTPIILNSTNTTKTTIITNNTNSTTNTNVVTPTSISSVTDPITTLNPPNTTTTTSNPVTSTTSTTSYSSTSNLTNVLNNLPITSANLNRTIQGLYQLKLPLQQIKIKNNYIILTISNTHVFSIVTSKVTNGTSVVVASVKFTLVNSSKIVCDQDYDRFYINLLTKTNLYELKQNDLKLFRGRDILASAKRNQYFTLPSDKLDGRWDMQIPSLPLNVTKINLFILDVIKIHYYILFQWENKYHQIIQELVQKYVLLIMIKFILMLQKELNFIKLEALILFFMIKMEKELLMEFQNLEIKHKLFDSNYQFIFYFIKFYTFSIFQILKLNQLF